MQASTATAEPLASAAEPSHGTEIELVLPLELLDIIAQVHHFRSWRVLKYLQILENAVLVPDGAPTINAAINAAAHGGVVLVREGTYVESVRVTKDVTICGLGEVTVVPPGWEAAFVWGGYSVGRTRAGDEVLTAASAGAHARVCHIAVRLRNQQQQTAIYLSGGSPTLDSCDIQGTVVAAGPRTKPTLTNCVISGSRGFGVKVDDRATPVLRDVSISCCRRSGIGVGGAGNLPTVEGVLRCRENWRCASSTNPDEGYCRMCSLFADVCGRTDDDEGAVDRFGLPTHWYHPPTFSDSHEDCCYGPSSFADARLDRMKEAWLDGMGLLLADAFRAAEM